MPQNITKSAKDIVKAALSAVPAISVEEAMGLVGSSEHVFGDLRDGTEQAKTGIIPGAVASSRGMMEFHIDRKPGPQTRVQPGQDLCVLLRLWWAIRHGGASRDGHGAFPGGEPFRRGRRLETGWRHIGVRR